MAAKIGSETTATFWHSITNNTRTPICASNPTPIRRRRTSPDLCTCIHQLARAPSPWAVHASPGPCGPNSSEPNSSPPSILQDSLKFGRAFIDERAAVPAGPSIYYIGTAHNNQLRLLAEIISKFEYLEPLLLSVELKHKDDLVYLFKLTIGSVVGAALIKYGSAAVPDITRPHITVALLMISTPPLVAVLLLANESRKD